MPRDVEDIFCLSDTQKYPAQLIIEAKSVEEVKNNIDSRLKSRELLIVPEDLK